MDVKLKKWCDQSCQDRTPSIAWSFFIWKISDNLCHLNICGVKIKKSRYKCRLFEAKFESPRYNQNDLGEFV